MSKSSPPLEINKHSSLAGVDTHKGDHCSSLAYSFAKSTFKNRKGRFGEPLQSEEGMFSQCIHCPPFHLAIASDGIGSKVEVAERMGSYGFLASDLLAMLVDDLVCSFAEPCSVSNVLDVDLLDEKVVHELMESLALAASQAGISITGGEIAELGNRVSGYGNGMHFNWSGTALGVMTPYLQEKWKQRPLLQEGDHILVFQSQGFRSNGFSLLRHILSETYGSMWHEAISQEDALNRTWGEILSIPSRIFSSTLSTLLQKKFQIKGIAHITGGGLSGNLSRILKQDLRRKQSQSCEKQNPLGVCLDNLFEPYSFMKEIQALGEICEKKAYEVWNMGQAMAFIVSPHESAEVLEFLREKYANDGLRVKVAGYLREKPEICLYSKGAYPSALVWNI